jgi:hypothetical protein
VFYSALRVKIRAFLKPILKSPPARARVSLFPSNNCTRVCGINKIFNTKRIICNFFFFSLFLFPERVHVLKRARLAVIVSERERERETTRAPPCPAALALASSPHR